MRLKNLNGKIVYKNVESRRIKWSGKSRSNFQFQSKEILKDFWENHVVYEEFPVYGSKLTLDFFNANKRIALEIQGNQHIKYNKFFHNGNRGEFKYQIQKDELKRNFCEINDIELFEIFEEDFKKYKTKEERTSFFKALGILS